MKTLNNYITEKLVIGKNIIHKKIQVSTKEELKQILEERLSKDKNANLNDLDVHKIKYMGELFYELDPHNIDISNWDVSNVTDMGSMFEGCKNFNSDLSKWNVSKVKIMNYMFTGCETFNSDLSNWNVSNVQDTDHMFWKCTSLKNIPSWYKE